MKYFQKIRFIHIFYCIVILFFVAVALDITPYLRGPAPYPPEWRWSYLFINIFSRIWAPVLTGSVIILISWFIIQKDNIFIQKQKTVLLFGVIILGFLFQLSLLYYSRSGIKVLFNRIANPDMNGYFTVATQVEPQNIPEFLRAFNRNSPGYPMHARSHPPGGILLFVGLNYLSSKLPAQNTLTAYSPQKSDVAKIWNTLSPSHKISAVLSGFVIILLSLLAILPLYGIATELYGAKAGIYASFLYISVPALSLFAPLPDTLYPLFGLTALYFMIRFFKKKQFIYLFLTGLFLFIGVFFSLTVLPVILLLIIYYIMYFTNNGIIACPESPIHDSGVCACWRIPGMTDIRFHFNNILIYITGFCIIPLMLYTLFQFNIIEVILTIINTVPDKLRSYPIWLLYDLYDFFIFVGLPVSLIFWLSGTKFTKKSCLVPAFSERFIFDHDSGISKIAHRETPLISISPSSKPASLAACLRSSLKR